MGITVLMKYRPLLAACGIVAALFAVTSACFVLGFETNDDAAMMLTAYGIHGGEQSPHLWVTNFLLGQLLVFLYAVAPGVHWYVLYLYAVHLLAVVALLYVFLRAERPLPILLFAVIWLVVVEAQFLVTVQMTSTSFLAGIAGVLLLLSLAHDEYDRRWPVLLAALGLLLVCGLIRHRVFMLLVLLSLPTLCLSFYWTRSRMLLSGAVLACSLFVVGEAVEWSSLDESYRRYYRHIQSLGKIMINPRYAYGPQSREIYDSIGWSENDLRLKDGWFYYDKEVYSFEAFDRLLDWEPVFIAYNPLRPLFRVMRRSPVAVLFSIALLILLYRRGPPRARRQIAIAATFALLGAMALGYSWRIPVRVFVPMLMFVDCVALYYAGRSAGALTLQGISRRARILLGILAVTLIVAAVSNLFQVSRARAREYEQAEILFDELRTISTDLGDLFVLATVLPIEYTFRHDLARKLSGVDYLMYGWPTYSPVNDHLLDRRGIDRPIRALFEREDTALVANGNTEVLAEFIRQHHGHDVEFQTLWRFGESHPSEQQITRAKVMKVYLSNAHRDFEEFDLLPTQSCKGEMGELQSMTPTTNPDLVSAGGWAMDPRLELPAREILLVHEDVIVARAPTGRRRDLSNETSPGWRRRYSGWKTDLDLRSVSASDGRIDLYLVSGRGHEICKFGEVSVTGTRG